MVYSKISNLGRASVDFSKVNALKIYDKFTILDIRRIRWIAGLNSCWCAQNKLAGPETFHATCISHLVRRHNDTIIWFIFTVIQDDNKASRCSTVQWHVMNFPIDDGNFQCPNSVTVKCWTEVRWSLMLQVCKFLGRTDVCSCCCYSAHYHWQKHFLCDDPYNIIANQFMTAWYFIDNNSHILELIEVSEIW